MLGVRNEYGAVVERIGRLNVGEIPRHLRKTDPETTGREFDPNSYFKVLTHLSVSDGYTRDYSYSFNIISGCALADKITEDAVSVSGDLHIWVEAKNPMVQVSSDPVNRDASELRRDNFDFREARMLPGNIGYIRFDMIHDDEEAQEIMAAAVGVCEIAKTGSKPLGISRPGPFSR